MFTKPSTTDWPTTKPRTKPRANARTTAAPVSTGIGLAYEWFLELPVAVVLLVLRPDAQRISPKSPRSPAILLHDLINIGDFGFSAVFIVLVYGPAHDTPARIVSRASPSKVLASATALTSALSSSEELAGLRNRCAASTSLAALARWCLACSRERLRSCSSSISTASTTRKAPGR